MNIELHNEKKEHDLFAFLLCLPERAHEVIEKLSSDHFYTSTAKTLYNGFRFACAMYEEVGILQLQEVIESEELLDMVFTASSNYVGISDKQLNMLIEHIVYYYNARNMYRAMKEIERDLIAKKKKPEQIIAESQKKFNDATGNTPYTNVSTGVEVVGDLFDEWSRYVDGDEQTKKELEGIKTGFWNIDHIIKGMKKGQYIILAANPSVGKTTLALNIIKNVLEEGKRVLLFSLEMNKKEIIKKMVEVYTRESIGVAISNEESFRLFSPKLDTIGSLENLLIEDHGTMTTQKIRDIVRQYSYAEDIDLVVVDYLQLITPSNPRAPKTQQVGDISREVNAITKDFNIPVLCLSQLSRENMKTGGFNKKDPRRPVLSDLRDSGSIEQDADIVMMLYRKDYQQQDNNKPVKSVEVWIRKNRTGPVGGVNLYFKPSISSFKDNNITMFAEESEEDDKPIGDMFENESI